jgi:phosphatidylglycerophosphatase A
VRLAALSLATSFGVGYIPFAPGTFGSLVGLAVWLALPPAWTWQAAGIACVLALGVWSGTAAERHFRTTDPSPVVIDEVGGMLVTLFLNPVGWPGALLAFLLFRFFDVIKPYPANKLERLHGGLGVMADDLMSAIYANMTLRAALLAADLLA